MDKTFFSPCYLLVRDSHNSNYANSEKVSNDALGPFNGPVSVSVTPDGTTAFVVNSGNNTISIVDVATQTVTGLISDPLATLNQPFWLAIISSTSADFSVSGKTGKDNFLTESNVFVKLSWNAPSGGTFQIYRDSKLVGTVQGQGALEFTDNNLKSKKTYTYRVVGLSGGLGETLVIKAR